MKATNLMPYSEKQIAVSMTPKLKRAKARVERATLPAELIAMGDKVSHKRPVHVVKCSCGHPTCGKYGLSDGTFYQGSGWDEDTAEFYAALINWFRACAALDKLTKGKKS